MSDTNGTAVSTAPKIQYIPVPEDPPNKLCPICQESFDQVWLEEAQDFVWMDAVKKSGRIYHASCHAEVAKDDIAKGLRATPDPESVLGKRKGMVDVNEVGGSPRMSKMLKV